MYGIKHSRFSLILLIPFIWVGNIDEGYNKVDIIYVDDLDFCGYKGYFLGCYHQGMIGVNPKIILVYDNMFDIYKNNTVWDHEILHAWGYNHKTLNSYI
jgi:hypothetical protein